MPIEIKELHIRVAVEAASDRQPPGPRGTVVGGGSADRAGDDYTNTIVAECIEQVLEILQNKAER